MKSIRESDIIVLLSSIMKNIKHDNKIDRGDSIYYAIRNISVDLEDYHPQVEQNSIYITVYLGEISFDQKEYATEVAMYIIRKIQTLTNNNIGKGYEVYYSKISGFICCTIRI